MKQVMVISVIVILSCILIVPGDSNPMTYYYYYHPSSNEVNPNVFNVLHTAINSFTNVVVKYHNEFDKKVKCGPLQQLLTEIDQAMIGYQGKAKEKLDETRKLNSDTRLAYEDCVGPVFEWCVGINGTLDIIIKNLNDRELSYGDRDAIWNIAVELVTQGQAKISNSIELLANVQLKMNQVKNILEDISSDMNFDFSPDGFYGKATNNLIKSIKDERLATEQRRKNEIKDLFEKKYFFIDSVYKVISYSFNTIRTVFEWNDNSGRGRQALPEPPSNISTYEQKIHFIKDFFDQLNRRTTLASKIATEMNTSLAGDKKNLIAIRNYIHGTINKQQFMKLSYKLRAGLIPSFQELGKKCYDYTRWDGYDSEGCKNKNDRARRQAFNEMDCGFTNFQTSPKNQQLPDLLHKNSGPKSIHKTTKKS